MNLPNKLTILRVILIPVFIIFLIKEYYYISGILFVAASITDALDGYLARKYHLITDFGKIIDPLADKLLITSALVCLVQLGSIAGWLAIVILAREFVITSLRSIAATKGIIIVAERSGKIKTVVQMLALSVKKFKHEKQPNIQHYSKRKKPDTAFCGKIRLSTLR